MDNFLEELCNNFNNVNISNVTQPSIKNDENSLIKLENPIKESIFDKSKYSLKSSVPFNHSKYQYNVYNAIRKINDRNGSSLAAIKSWLLKNVTNWTKVNNNKINKLAIQPMVKNGLLIKNIGKFKLSHKSKTTKWNHEKFLEVPFKSENHLVPNII
jgi:hypothetical protein